MTVRTPRPIPLLDGLLVGARYALVIHRRPASIAGAVVFPVVFALLFLAVFQRAMDRIGVDYAQFLIPAVVLQAMFFTGMSSAVLAAEDVAGGLLSRLRSLPVSRAAPFLGLLAAQSLRALVSMAVLIPLALAIGFRFDTGAAGAVGFITLSLGFALTACAGYIALGLAVGRPDTAQALVMLPYFPLLLVSNAFTPADRFPGWLQPVVRNQPVSQVCDALRAFTVDGADVARPTLEALAWLLPLVVVFALLAARGVGRAR